MLTTWTAKTEFTRSQVGIKTRLGTGLQSHLCLTKNLFAFYLCPENVREADIKGNGENPRQLSTQPVVWFWWAIFSWVYSENWEQNAENF